MSICPSQHQLGGAYGVLQKDNDAFAADAASVATAYDDEDDDLNICSVVLLECCRNVIDRSCGYFMMTIMLLLMGHWTISIPPLSF